MKTNKTEKFDLSKFETLEINGETLKGGFSAALTINAVGGLLRDGDNYYKCGQTNNCQSGNCVAGCGGDTSTTTLEA
ncbi:hypothetical protein [Flavobacterium oreochromis]|uniref:Uncharacterized protein n=2 Tax=Flavobacterium TaxID=237 RepID=A0A246G9B9_9FLAO|nr:hypothetical protein [Flavobacterium oreochromis]OWP76157.1 hypothetical protein BWK62_10335 [Flavobacterium oreochromis]OWP76429.1 hypothetical protein BWG23_08130 [Flavobacterium oreochromis]POR21324.1 hypothetical protein BWK58_12565 [Flavobacterium columnare]QYS86291.1 hypothetical protein JJC03_15395 [Flavobacterium oreochromis]